MHNKTKLISIKFIFFFFLFSFFLPVFSVSAIDIKLKPQVTIDSQFKQGSEIDVPTDMSLMISLIKTFYKYSIGVVGILAAIALMIAGLLWLTAGGNSSQLGTAKEIIKGSFLGLILVLLSFTILATVNPGLVQLENISIAKIAKKDIGLEIPTVKSYDSAVKNVKTSEQKTEKITTELTALENAYPIVSRTPAEQAMIDAKKAELAIQNTETQVLTNIDNVSRSVVVDYIEKGYDTSSWFDFFTSIEPGISQSVNNIARSNSVATSKLDNDFYLSVQNFYNTLSTRIYNTRSSDYSSYSEAQKNSILQAAKEKYITTQLINKGYLKSPNKTEEIKSR